MLQPLLELYNVIAAASSKFTERNLSGNFFVDVYRSQPFEPERYEYYPLPAIFVDYTMTGSGKNKPRSISITLHIITDEMPDASNISTQNVQGLNKILYNLTLQEVLDGAQLGESSQLRFRSENSVDAQVTNYHTQTYEFEAFLTDMIGDIETIYATFEKLNIYGSLLNQL